MGRRTTRKRARHAVLTFDGKWWTAEAPYLPGACSQGRTRQSALRNLQSAIKELVETYDQLGQEPPYVEVGEVEVELIEMAG